MIEFDGFAKTTVQTSCHLMLLKCVNIAGDA